MELKVRELNGVFNNFLICFYLKMQNLVLPPEIEYSVKFVAINQVDFILEFIHVKHVKVFLDVVIKSLNQVWDRARKDA